MPIDGRDVLCLDDSADFGLTDDGGGTEIIPESFSKDLEAAAALSSCSSKAVDVEATTCSVFVWDPCLLPATSWLSLSADMLLLLLL